MYGLLKALLLALVFMPLPVWAEDPGETEEILSAGELLSGCEEGALPDQPNQYCMRYVFGLVQTVLGLQQADSGPPLFCIDPQVIRLEEVTDTVVKFLRGNAERFNEDAYLLVTEALNKHYPCDPPAI